jgi:hypothetical protein
MVEQECSSLRRGTASSPEGESSRTLHRDPGAYLPRADDRGRALLAAAPLITPQGW